MGGFLILLLYLLFINIFLCRFLSKKITSLCPVISPYEILACMADSHLIYVVLKIVVPRAHGENQLPIILFCLFLVKLAIGLMS